MISGVAAAKVAKAIGLKGFVIIGLLIALGIVIWRADAISADREDQRNKLAAERAQHAVTRNSVDTLTASLAKFVGAGQASRIAQLAAIEAQAEDNARLQGQADAIRAEMASLAPDGRCATPSSIINAEGL
jgi:predicted negative regulator of RcsB-dependent stress response